MEARTGCVLLIWFLAVTEVSNYTGQHSLTIFVTFAPGHSYIPEYSSYGMLDDLKVFHYESNSRELTSPLKRHTSLSSVWVDLHACTAFKTDNFKQFIKQANSTSGFKGTILQLMYGCKLSGEGEQTNLYQFSVNGRYTFTLDEDSLQWNTLDTHAVTLKKILDNLKIWNRNNFKYIKQDCVPRLKKFYEHGKEIIHRKEQPVVTIQSRRGVITVLTCTVTGFYPGDISVHWLQDGSRILANVTSSGLLPNPDLTYQVRERLDVLHSDRHRYTCLVEHISLLRPLLVHWDPAVSERLSRHTELMAVCSCVLFLLVVALLLIWRRCKPGELTDAG